MQRSLCNRRSHALPVLLAVLGSLTPYIAANTSINSPSFNVGQWRRSLEKPWWPGHEGNGKENGNDKGKWVSQGEDKDHIDDEWKDSDSSNEESKDSDSVDEKSKDHGDRSASVDESRPNQLIPKQTPIPTQRPTPTPLFEDAPAPTPTNSIASDPAVVRVVSYLSLNISPVAESSGAMDANVVWRFEDACGIFVSEALPIAIGNASCKVRGQELLVPPMPDGPGIRRILGEGRKLEADIADKIDEDWVTDAFLSVHINIFGRVSASSAPNFQEDLVALFRMRGRTFLSILKEEKNQKMVQRDAKFDEGRNYFRTAETVLVIDDGGAMWGANAFNQNASNTSTKRGLIISLSILAVLFAVALIGVALLLCRRRREANQRAWAAAPRLRPKRPCTGATSAWGDEDLIRYSSALGGQDGPLAAASPPNFASEGDDACTDPYSGIGNSAIGIGTFKCEEVPISATPAVADDCDLLARKTRTQVQTNDRKRSNLSRGSTPRPSCGNSMTLSVAHGLEEASASPPSLAYDGQSMLVPTAVLSAGPANIDNDIVSLSLPSAVPYLRTNGDDSAALGAAPSAFSVAAVTVESPIPLPRDAQAMSTVDSIPRWYKGTSEEECTDRENVNQEVRNSDEECDIWNQNVSVLEKRRGWRNMIPAFDVS